MDKIIQESRESSRAVMFSTLEAFAREQIQLFIQRLLEEEVTELLGRAKSERRDPAKAEQAYRNGYGKERGLTLSCGTVKVRRPRVRGFEEGFESKLLPFFKRRSTVVDRVLPELYLHGLAEGDFDLALRGLLGKTAPISAGSIARLKAQWQLEYDAWRTLPLGELEVVYCWADGVYVKAGIDAGKSAMLVVIGALADGTKRVLAVESGYRESAESWGRVLRDLKARGLSEPRVLSADGHLGIWKALAEIYPACEEQRCWNHKLMNVLDCVTKAKQPVVREELRAMMYAESREQCETLRKRFHAKYQAAFPKAVETLERDWERLMTYYSFPSEHWVHLRTTNPVESPFAAVRLRTTAAKRYKKVENATALIWKLLLIAEQTFRRLNAPELLPAVAAGAVYENGKAVKHVPEKAAA
ncbi:MAG: IS256 family transposase [Acidobacteria bacterium]|nr:IS256 family transposase [Acidobacteriota bacterium]